MMKLIEIFYESPLLEFLFNTTIKGCVIFAIAGVLAYHFRRKSAAVRCFIWGMAIVGCLTISLFSLILPKWELGILPKIAVSSEKHQSGKFNQSPVPILNAQRQLTGLTASTTDSPSSSQPIVETSINAFADTIQWTNWIGFLWAGISVFFFTRLLFGIGAVCHLSIRARNFNRTIKQQHAYRGIRFTVRLSDKIKIPMVWGIFRPVILLPTDAENWETERLRAVLLHETAHIKRGDWLMQTIAHLVCAVYWFNPLLWFAARQMRMEAEQACDDQVLNTGYQSTDYAQHLLGIVRNVKLDGSTSRVAVNMAHSSKIEGRLRTILTENLNRHPVTNAVVGIGIIILVCSVVPIGAMHLAQADDPKVVSKYQLAYDKDRSDDPIKAQQNVEICKQHLLEIGLAIKTYKLEHGDFPEWLSELHPKYLSDAGALLCPADENGGETYFLVNADPKLSMSYDYQFHPKYREGKTEERLMYGDVLPLVRCRHHANQPFECLNLSFSYKVYWSSGVYTPDEMYETVGETIETLEKGLQRQADNERFFHLYTTLAHLYIEVGREKDFEGLVNRFKSVMRLNSLSDSFRLGSILEIANRHEEVLKVFEKLEELHPDNNHVLDKLARIHEKLGNAELSAEYKKKADPLSELVGKFVPDFSATDLDGKPISLQQYRGKVVLLDFWAVWCPPCIVEMPNVKRVYDTYKDQGFDIIGVSLDTDETRLRNYLKTNEIPWRQIFSGQKWNSPLAKKYHIHSIPAPWLIARDGTLISRKARGIELERLVVEALKNKSENE